MFINAPESESYDSAPAKKKKLKNDECCGFLLPSPVFVNISRYHKTLRKKHGLESEIKSR